MLALKKIISSLLLSCFFSVLAYADASNGDLFAYIAANYPALFSGTPQIGATADYNYAYYPTTGNYIGTSNGNVYISGPAITGGAIKYYGALSNLMPAITQWQATGTLSLLTGLEGPQGRTGMYGLNGATGAAGAQGSQGNTGTNGINGTPGAHAVDGTVVGQTLVWNGAIWNPTTTTTLTIGQQYQGGKIFWLDSTGQHGLVVALSDTAQAMPLSLTDTQAGAYGSGIYAGKANTAMINANNIGRAAGSTAANQAIQFSRQQTGGACNIQPCFTDWYVPSADELFILHGAVQILNSDLSFDQMSTEYWCSTDQNNQFGSMNSTVNFGNPYSQFSRARTSPHNVRLIRSF